MPLAASSPAPSPASVRRLDALRRDFTVNALYYDPHSGTVFDEVGGVGDLRLGVVRMIGQTMTDRPTNAMRAVSCPVSCAVRCCTSGVSANAEL